MARALRIALVPGCPRLGAVGSNADALLAARAEAGRAGASLLLAPLASLSGAPAAALARYPDFRAACEAALARLAAATADGGPGLAVGLPWQEGMALYEGVALLDAGRVVARRARHVVPAEEGAVFAAGPSPGPVAFRGLRLGLMAGTDLDDPAVPETLAETGAEILVPLSAIPFRRQPADRAIDRAVPRVVESSLPLLALNLRAAQGAETWPGGGFALNADCSLAARHPEGAPGLWLTDWEEGAEGWRCAPQPLPPPEAEPARLWRALASAVAGAVAHGGFSGVLVDPAQGEGAELCAALAAPLPVWRAGAGEAAGHAREAALWAEAEARGALLLNAADKTALALGEGHRAGHFAPLRDLFRSELGALAAEHDLPAPPADAATDALLRALLEEHKGVDALAAGGYDPHRALDLWRRLAAAAASRRRAPEGPRLSRQGFGHDPVGHGFAPSTTG
ncbi:hypothetical protein CR162_17955 [Pseudoroseomonas rhizosphaerae]|uniref:CN hydrolase domain-containing protein n=1 Tax=Teichococcus rhizosphaerae TaxID=1335062 RepID=A0A2C7A0I5_9PROT|nr:nitrilase-related carbon-nitrogen hydrolase [Pseudoroseomonas rhizosphaerae]PHK93568.1 hypothetical protein CR162_17955 [Pseudoroseomonas rhizosphaerae]